MSEYLAPDGTDEGATISGVTAPGALAQEVLGEEQVLSPRGSSPPIHDTWRLKGE